MSAWSCSAKTSSRECYLAELEIPPSGHEAKVLLHSEAEELTSVAPWRVEGPQAKVIRRLGKQDLAQRPYSCQGAFLTERTHAFQRMPKIASKLDY